MQLLSASVIVVGYVDDPMVAVLFLTLSITAESNAGGHIWTMITEVVPPKLAGSVGGFINSSGSLAGIISPILTGTLVKLTGSFRLALTIGGCSMLLATLITLFVVPDLKVVGLAGKKSELEPTPANAAKA